MRRAAAHAVPLFLLLCGFTAINLTPIIWGVLTSIKQPVDAFAVPPKLIFTRPSNSISRSGSRKAFWHFLINSVVISVGTVVTVGLDRHHGRLWAVAAGQPRVARPAVRPAGDADVSANPAGDSVLRAGANRWG